MRGFPAIAMALIALAASIGPAYRQWKTGPRGFWITVGYFVLYGLYCALGMIILFGLAPREPTGGAGIGMMTFVFAWIAYGALWLYRLVPDYENAQTLR